MPPNVKIGQYNDGRSDEVLWNAFKHGDKQAYSIIYQRYIKMLSQYGLKIVNERELVKDCIHDLFVEMWKNKNNLVNPESVKAYLLKSIQRKLLRQIRKRRNSAIQNVAYPSLKIVDCKEDQLIEVQSRQEQEKEVSQAMLALTKRQKEAIYLKFYLNLSYNEIADIMDISVNAIYNLISKSIDVLQHELKKPQ